MKPRKSTAMLAALWLATLVVYILVKPETPHPDLPTIANTFEKSTVRAPAR